MAMVSPFPKSRFFRTFKIGVKLGHDSGIKFTIVGWQQVYLPLTSYCAFGAHD